MKVYVKKKKNVNIQKARILEEATILIQKIREMLEKEMTLRIQRTEELWMKDICFE